jgi:hypothetical protein
MRQLAVWFLLSALTGCTPQSADPDPPSLETLTSAPPEPKTGRQPAAPDASVPDAVTKPRLLNKTFDDLKFDIEPDGDFKRDLLTPEIEKLAGEAIRIRGYILPTAQKRLTSFVLVRDNQECCFGPGAALFDCILVEMAPGESADFSVRPVTVTGKFRIEEFALPGGRPLAIFQMRGESVEN